MFSFLLLLALTAPPQLEWTPLPPIPDAEGYAGGFAGVSHGAMIFAGGSNFVGRRPWDGGSKQWYDKVYVLTSPEGHWILAGHLPKPNGYGVSGTFGDKLILAGGGSAAENYTAVIAVSWDHGSLVRDTLPSLPQPRAFTGGMVVDGTLYVAGGTEQTQFVAVAARRNVWALDLNKAGSSWRELPPLPGPGRIYPIVGSSGGNFYVFGGVALSPDGAGRQVKTYLKDAYVLRPGQGWSRIADLPHPEAGAPTPAAAAADGRLLIFTGDDGTRVKLDGPNHPGFPEHGIIYDPRTDRWGPLPEIPISRSTAPTVVWRDMWVMVGGERKPGYRTPEVWGLKLVPAGQSLP